VTPEAEPQDHDPWDAIILAGGRADRLGGTAKPAVLIGKTSLLDRTIAAAQGAELIVLAGDVEAEGCVTAREPEPFGGPVAGIAAALPLCSADRVLVVACDHPFVDRAVAALTEAEPGRDGVIAVDESGRHQNLLVCLNREALVAALDLLDSPVDVSMRQLLAGLDVREIVVDERAAFDVDTWDDVTRGRELDESEVTNEHD
jgi:molybdopterin-guanine dinucleotide biosynthesis protein A